MTAPLLTFTIDVEEDMPRWEIQPRTRLENLRSLPVLADLCREYDVRPTYLCTYPVVADPASADILRGLRDQGDCEIGTHLHPWNTPPYRGIPGSDADEQSTAYYLSALGPELFRDKLEVLHEKVSEVAGKEPVSFRAGRYGIDSATLAELIPLGYQVDTSVTPLADHSGDGGPDFRSAPQLPYRPDRDDVRRVGDLSILEIPVSIALTRSLPRIANQLYVHMPRRTRLRGLLSKDYLGWVDYAWLYPARFGVDLMQKAALTLKKQETPVFNVFLHSSEILAGKAGRIESGQDAEDCLARIRGILSFCRERFGARPATLAEAARELRPDFGLENPAPAS